MPLIGYSREATLNNKLPAEFRLFGSIITGTKCCLGGINDLIDWFYSLPGTAVNICTEHTAWSTTRKQGKGSVLHRIFRYTKLCCCFYWLVVVASRIHEDGKRDRPRHAHERALECMIPGTCQYTIYWYFVLSVDTILQTMCTWRLQSVMQLSNSPRITCFRQLGIRSTCI